MNNIEYLHFIIGVFISQIISFWCIGININNIPVKSVAGNNKTLHINMNLFTGLDKKYL